MRMNNKKTRIINGNRSRALNLVHWNIGAAQLPRKIQELRQAVVDFQPDIMVVSEANLMAGTPGHEIHIDGFDMITPPTMDRLGHCRLVVLVKQNIAVEIMNDIMEDDLPNVWIKIRRQGKKNLIIGTIYREHHQLKQPKQTPSENLREQIIRWDRTLSQWEKAAKRGETTIIGDINLDYLTWDSPTHGHKTMVEAVKVRIETIGFHQMMRGHTRSWHGQADTMIDQIWTDNPGNIISTRNEVRGASYHRIISTNLRMKGKENGSCNFLRRDMSRFSLQSYRDKLKELPWQELYQKTDVNQAWIWLESSLQEVLGSECPIKIIQPNQKLKSWITAETSDRFKQRDRCLQIARQTNLQSDWEEYKIIEK